MGKHRDFLDIVASVLEAAGEGTNKTRIMFQANLSFKLLEKYLKLTRSSGLLNVNNSTYELTPNGRVFVNKYRSICEKNSSVNDSLTELNRQREELLQMCNEIAGDSLEKPVSSSKEAVNSV